MSKKNFFIVFLFFVLSINVFGQEKSGLAVSPPSFEINGNPGDIIQNTIKVDNLSPFSLKVKAVPQNFVAYGEGGQVNLTNEESSFSISNWLKITNKEQTISPKSFALYDFEIKIPDKAEPGSHYGAVVFSTKSNDLSKGSGASISQEIGSLILIKLPGKVFEDAKLISFNSLSSVYKEPKIKLIALLENTGNVHVKPYGFINLTNIFGQKVKTIEIKGKNILPGSKRIFEEEFKFEKIGYFKADINLLYSGGGRLMKSETSFVTLNLDALKKYLIFGIIAVIIYFILSKRINRALKVILTGK